MLIVKTTDITVIRPTPYLLAAKNAGMPSTIGDDPRINSKVVRPDFLCADTDAKAPLSLYASPQDALSPENGHASGYAAHPGHAGGYGRGGKDEPPAVGMSAIA